MASSTRPLAVVPGADKHLIRAFAIFLAELKSIKGQILLVENDNQIIN